MSSERIERLFDAHYERLVRYVKKFVRFTNEDDARSVVSDALFKVHERFPDIAPGAEAAYAYTTARNEALNFVRDRKAARRDWRREVDVTKAANERDQDPLADELLIEGERRARLTALMAELPDPSRECLVAHLAGKSSDEIARDLGMTSVAVRSRISRAKQQLKKQLEEDGHVIRK